MPTGIYKRKEGCASPSWKGGRHKSSYGYWLLFIPSHPRACSCGRVMEHIVMAEKLLGRSLRKGEVVHHMGRKGDNSRIKICKSAAEHARLHVRLRAVRAGALPSWRKCTYCQKYDKPDNVIIDKYSRVYHKECLSLYHKKYYHKRKKENLCQLNQIVR